MHLVRSRLRPLVPNSKMRIRLTPLWPRLNRMVGCGRLSRFPVCFTVLQLSACSFDFIMCSCATGDQQSVDAFGMSTFTPRTTQQIDNEIKRMDAELMDLQVSFLIKFYC